MDQPPEAQALTASYERFLAMLQYVLEREYEFILAVEVPQEKRVAGSKRR